MKKRISALLLCLALGISMLPLSGCGTTAVAAANLMKGVNPRSVDTDTDITGEGALALTDFGVRLFQQSLSREENTLISPLSVIFALGMVSGGARGVTLEQLESAFGMSGEELREYLCAYMKRLPQGEKYKLTPANSIWLKDDGSFTANRDFLQQNADYYSADIYSASFDDSTLRDINTWVKDNTDGMIDSILDSIPENAVMYLVNALAFDAEWQSIYESTQVRNGIFTTEDGQTRNVELMRSTESRYLEDENASGFIKYYSGGKYAFAALLPDEGVSVSDYAASLTGEKLHAMLSQPQAVTVNAAIPKFESEYSVEMSSALKAMGITDAFDYTVSDFSGIGFSTQGNLVISRVLHKTFIAVNEKGTKAGAATAVEMVAEGAIAMPEEIRTVRLDRPFVYMLIDCETNLPVFIGAVMDITK